MRSRTRTAPHGHMRTCWAALLALTLAIPAGAKEARAAPRVASICELDLTGDQRPDLAMLVATSSGRQLLLLVRTANGYTAHTLPGGSPLTKMTCQIAGELVETSAGRGPRQGKRHQVPGAYVLTKEEEGSAVAYYWNGSGFQKVWVAD